MFLEGMLFGLRSEERMSVDGEESRWEKGTVPGTGTSMCLAPGTGQGLSEDFKASPCAWMQTAEGGMLGDRRPLNQENISIFVFVKLLSPAFIFLSPFRAPITGC